MIGNQMNPGMEGMIPREGVATIVPTTGISKRVKRYGFQSLEFAKAEA